MTKKNTKKKNVTNNKKSATAKQVQRYASLLDTYAMGYARLLADPCSAPLVNAVMPGPSGGIVIRCESYLALGNGTDERAGIFHWVPNAMGNTGDAATPKLLGTRTFTAANSGTANSLLDAKESVPGYNFLRTNASSYRCIAACAQLMTNASEMNRAGVVSVGSTVASYIMGSDTVTPNVVRSQLPVAMRTPSELLEVKFVPRPDDELFTDPSSSSGGKASGCAALTMTWSGDTSAAGCLVRMIAVYEYLPQKDTGITFNASSANKSRNTINQILAFLEEKGKWWFNHSASHTIMKTVMNRGVTGVGLLMAP